jgi:hypothetical protein
MLQEGRRADLAFDQQSYLINNRTGRRRYQSAAQLPDYGGEAATATRPRCQTAVNAAASTPPSTSSTIPT